MSAYPSERTAAMHAMVDKYTASFPTPVQKTASKPRSGDVILVTGTTGSLGCHLLDTLASSSQISRVFALNRASKQSTTLRERQRSALVDRGIDATILCSSKITLLEGDLTAYLWGLSETAYYEVYNSVTHIIHNAWPVDFVSGLIAFEPAVEALRNLVDFALTSPLSSAPRLLFTSSVAVIQQCPLSVAIPEAPADAVCTINNGYSEAKWVGEQILYAAATKTLLDPLIIRVGQLTGGQAGVWSAHEWFPAMVQSGAQLGCFPDDWKAVDWLPFDLAATAITEFRNISNNIRTVHLAHPRPVSWHSIAVQISSEYSVRLLPFNEWIAKLEQAARGMSQDGKEARLRSRKLRAALLIPFYRDLAAKASSSRMAVGLPEADITQAVQNSATLSDPNIRQIGEKDVKRWLAYWRRVGLLPQLPAGRL